MLVRVIRLLGIGIGIMFGMDCMYTCMTGSHRRVGRGSQGSLLSPGNVCELDVYGVSKAFPNVPSPRVGGFGPEKKGCWLTTNEAG